MDLINHIKTVDGWHCDIRDYHGEPARVASKLRKDNTIEAQLHWVDSYEGEPVEKPFLARSSRGS